MMPCHREFCWLVTCPRPDKTLRPGGDRFGTTHYARWVATQVLPRRARQEAIVRLSAFGAHVDAFLMRHEVRVAEPLVDPFRLGLRGVREHLGEAFGVDQMPAVFRRRGAVTVDDNRCGTVTLVVKNFFETNAIAGLRADFVRQPTVHAYRSLLDFAATIHRADTERAWALDHPRELARGVLVRLSLSEGDVDAAWEAADRYGPGWAWQELATQGAEAGPVAAADL